MMNERAEADETGEPMTLYQTKTASDWHDLYGIYMFFSEKVRSEWIFRGDSPASPTDGNHAKVLKDEMKSTLEQAFAMFGMEGKGLDEKRELEKALIREFRRNAPLHYERDLPNWLHNLALMRHHGAPTRFLDWTYSFWNAVYFACNRKEKKACVVWALNNEWLTQKTEEFEGEFIRSQTECERYELKKIKRDWPNYFQNKVVNFLVHKNPEKLVYPASPYFLPERLAIQQGVLLCQGNIGVTWGENLAEMLRSEEPGRLLRIEIELDGKKRSEILHRLYDMNINQTTLFPGLDGFAQSLWTRIAHPKSLLVDC